MNMDMDMEDDNSNRYRLKQFLCFSCCFGRRHHNRLPPPPPPPPMSDENPALIWVRTKGPRDFSLREFKDKWRSLFLSGNKHHNNNKHSSTEFRYDPLSYALNFEDGFEDDDAAPLKNFTARLPPSPRPLI